MWGAEVQLQDRAWSARHYSRELLRNLGFLEFRFPRSVEPALESELLGMDGFGCRLHLEVVKIWLPFRQKIIISCARSRPLMDLTSLVR
ncbi:Uncharacterised protein [Halioglobus japonicus]|nr:Uncharacterised protein [Halioglobus japonicus]